tara:strand:+ start:239 stop:472 length:234 start_codon:yes stop_codon:yes gene_type:complete
MKTKRSKKPTSKDFQLAIQEIQYRLMATQSQLNSLTEIFSDFLDYTNKKSKFMEYLKRKVEQEEPAEIKTEKEAEPV